MRAASTIVPRVALAALLAILPLVPGPDGKAEDFTETKRFVFDGTEYRIPLSGGGEKGVAR